MTGSAPFTDRVGFVGREAELARLDAALQEATKGHGRLILVGGEPGIGKSRLTDEFTGRARRAGARVVWGRCWEAGGAPPFWPWIECLRAYVTEQDPVLLREELGPGAPELAQMFPELRRVVPDVPEAPGGDPDAARFRLFDATSSFLRNAGRRKVLTLVLEDLHAADEPSLLLLRFVTRTLPSSPLVVVGTYRDTELSRDHPLSVALGNLAGERSVVRVSLGGLSREGVATFIEQVAGRVPPAELVAAIHEETEGNPLFVEEVVRLLSGEGLLSRPPERHSWGTLIPQGIREVIDRRMTRLSERCVETLTKGSVMGREFSLEVLERLDGLARPELLELLDEAASARVVENVPSVPGRIRFSHQLLRDALYDGLPPGQRVVLHRRVAEALVEIHGPDPGPLLAELAHHFSQAAPGGDVADAVTYSSRAGDQAAAMLAYEEAVRLYGMALRSLDLAPEADEAARCGLLLRLGEAQARAGDADTSRETFALAAQIARRRGMATEQALAALGYGGRFVWRRAGADRRLVALLEDAMASLGESHDHLKARVLARLAGALRDQWDPAPRNRLSREAVEIARRLDDPHSLAYVLDGRWAAIWGPDTSEERLPLADELIAVAEAVGDGERAFQGHHYRMVALLELGDVRAAREEVAAQERLAGELRQPAQGWYLAASSALLALFEGRLEEAERLSEQALRVGERAYSASEARFTYLLQLFFIRREQARMAEMEEAMLRSVTEYERSYPFVHGVMALLRIELGEHQEGRRLLEKLVDGREVLLPRDNEWMFGMCVLAEVASTLGDRATAGVLYEMLVPYAGRNVIAPIEAMSGSVGRFLGLLAAIVGHEEEADRHFADAVEMNRRMGAEPAAARTLLDLGRVLANRADPKPQRAVEALNEALEIAIRRGITDVARRSEGALRELGREPAGGERVARTFMFTDIVGSTALVEAVGDQAWEDLRRWHDRTLRAHLVRHHGEEIDHAGDGFFVAFPDPRGALECAVAIQRSLAEHRRSHGFAPRVRIGLHTGDATRTAEDYGGRTVHIAARIAAISEGDEIIVSAETVEGDVEAEVLRDRRSVNLKGISEPVTVLAVDWRVAKPPGGKSPGRAEL